MGRKRSAAGFLSQGAAGWQLLPGLVAAALVLWLAFLPGCNSQGASRQSNQQFRPIGNTARLMQNASYYRKVGRVELAVDELEQARMKEPNNLELMDILIQCYEDLGDFDRAQELYEQALAKQGGDQPAWENNRCYSLYLQGRLDQAETCFRKALARQPDNQKARNNLGLVLCRQGREAEALAMWREALSDTAARQRMGEAMAALGKDVPPSLAGPLPQAAPSQITAAASPPAPPAMIAALTPKAAPAPSPVPSAAIAAPQPATPTDVLISRATGEAEKPAPLKLPPPNVQAAAGPPAQPPAAPEPAEAQTASPKPEPNPVAIAAAPARLASPSAKAPTAPPVAAAMVTKPKPTILTALELEDTRIEVKNGNGVSGQARDVRSGLCLEGFNVVNIGNHIDFGLEATVIAYRPGSARVAQNLARNFFPNARLEENGDLSHWADVRISLGLDQVSGQNIARLRQEPPAAHASVPLPTPGRETAAPARKVEYRAHQLAAASEGPFPDYLTAQELNQARIELRNGNGIPGEAWEVSDHLAMEGFTIINVGNNQDFDLEKTVISYRPGAARVARVLSKKFFPKATLAEEGQLPPWMDVRVSLGRDLVDGHCQVAQAFSGALVP